MKHKLSAATVISLAVTCGMFSGCANTPTFPGVTPATTSTTETPTPASGLLKGRIHGGQQPIVGARIYLLAAGTTGYGSASTSLLTSASYTGYQSQIDSNGRYYVPTDASGAFQIVDTCTPGQQVYVASVGGNPGGGANTAANEIAVLGTCPAAGNFDSTLTGVYISEISTVAAAFATSAYAVDTFDIGGPSTTTLQGTDIANAFANAANLFDVQNVNDVARTTTIAGNGTVPQAKIHTIANVLASCINSMGPSSPSCSTLFTYAMSGGTTGTVPTDTVTAAINIAHNQSSLGTGPLFTLQNQNSPFSPQLGSAPNDFSVAISYPNASLGNNPSLAVDGGGNIWTLVPGSATVTKLSPLGAVLSGPTGYAVGNGFASGRGLAVDTSNNVWVVGSASNLLNAWATFGELNNTGVSQQMLNESTLLTYTHPPATATNLVIDGSGNFYYGAVRMAALLGSTTCCTVKFNQSTGAVTELDYGNSNPGTNFVALNNASQWTTSNTGSISEVSGGSKVKVTGGGLNLAAGVALDSAGNGWAVNSGSSSLSEFNSAGTAITGTSGYTGGGLSTPKAIAVGGSGSVWVTNGSGAIGLSQFTSSGVPVGTGYFSPALTSASGLALDGSGNVWVANSGSATIVQFLGLSGPVVTPMSAAVAANTLGTRP